MEYRQELKSNNNSSHHTELNYILSWARAFFGICACAFALPGRPLRACAFAFALLRSSFFALVLLRSQFPCALVGLYTYIHMHIHITINIQVHIIIIYTVGATPLARRSRKMRFLELI